MEQLAHLEDIQIVESCWNGFHRIDFQFSGRDALLVFPEHAANGNPWAQYTEYFGAFPDTALALVAKGYHLAYIQNTHRWGCEADYLLKKKFGQFLSEKFGLATRSTLIGMSCGGMIAVHVAARFPECVEALYLDAPVMNLLSCPLGVGIGRTDQALVDECLQALSTTASELISFRGHPLDEIPELIKARIPVVMVYGGADLTVPYTENGQLLENAYRNAGCPIVVWGKPECDHHPHGLKNPGPVVEQLEAWRKLRISEQQ